MHTALQDTQPPAAEPQLFEPRCTPLCVLIPQGSPGACERVLDPTKKMSDARTDGASLPVRVFDDRWRKPIGRPVA